MGEFIDGGKDEGWRMSEWLSEHRRGWVMDGGEMGCRVDRAYRERYGWAVREGRIMESYWRDRRHRESYTSTEGNTLGGYRYSFVDRWRDGRRRGIKGQLHTGRPN